MSNNNNTRIMEQLIEDLEEVLGRMPTDEELQVAWEALPDDTW